MGENHTIKGKGIAPASYFSKLHNLGAKRDTTIEHGHNSTGIYSINRLHRLLFCPIASRFQVREV